MSVASAVYGQPPARRLQSRTSASVASRIRVGDYPFLLSKNLNQMTIEDLLHSYMLAAYLIEGRPDDVVKLLRSFGEKIPPAQAVGEVLDMTLPGLETRVVRWARERK